MGGDGGTEFLVIRALALAVSWSLMGLTAGVVSWWAATSLVSISSGNKPTKTDELLLATALVGVTTFFMASLRLHFHYYLGMGDYIAAASWSQDIVPILQVFVIFQLLGYSLYVRYAWSDYTRRVLSIGAGLWVLLGLVIFQRVGGFEFDYVWKLSVEPRSIIPMECGQ